MNGTLLVTGGAGYIGSHTCKALSLAGYHPVTFDNLSKGRRELVKWGPLVEGDLRDPSAVSKVFKSYDFEAVIHIAALAAVEESVRDPLLYYQNNVMGSLNLMKAALDAGIQKWVFSSSAAVYGEPKASLSQGIQETTPHVPCNPYGATKSHFEQVLRDVSVSHGVRSIALRYFNAAGADPEGEIGDLRENPTHVIPLILEAAQGMRPEFQIYGNDYPTPDGTCVRDYIHVSDLARAHLLSLKYLEKNLDPTSKSKESEAMAQAFNLCTGQGISVRELSQAAQKVTQRDFTVVDRDRRPGDPPLLVGNRGRASEVLGWEPQYPKPEEILKTAWNWTNR